MSEPRLTARAEMLRRSFDQSFSEPPPATSTLGEDFLAIRAGGEAYAVRLREIAGLYANRQIVALPSPLPELLGIVGIRGSIRPVYDLATLLGHPPGDAGRWLLVTGGTEAIALAFSVFEGHFLAPLRDVERRDPSPPSHSRSPETVRVEDGVLPVVNLASLVEALTQRVRGIVPLKEP